MEGTANQCTELQQKKDSNIKFIIQHILNNQCDADIFQFSAQDINS